MLVKEEQDGTGDFPVKFSVPLMHYQLYDILQFWEQSLRFQVYR